MSDATDLGAGQVAADGTWTDEAEFAGWEDDLAELEAGDADSAPVPTLAVVGRPNVGKSTLVNRIIGRREAVVQDVPGVTRDRVTYDALWRGRRFTVVDTGGWLPRAEGLQAEVAAQAERAMSSSDAVLVVVDATVGATATDEAIARVLRRSKRPVLLAANKVDDERAEADAAQLWSLGLGEPYQVSALHGRGSGDLLDAILEALPEAPAEFVRRGRRPAPGSAGGQAERRQVLAAQPARRRVAVGGRCRRGHHDRPGRLAGRARRRHLAVRRHGWPAAPGQPGQGHGVLRLAAHPDGAGGSRSRDRADRFVGAADGAGPAGDLDGGRLRAGAGDRDEQGGPGRCRPPARDRPRTRSRPGAGAVGRADQRLGGRPAAACTGWVPPCGGRSIRGTGGLPTGRLNAWLGEVVAATPPPVRGGRQPKMLFATQAAHRPPTFVLFTTGFLEAGYRRFIERRLREDFSFVGSPVRINVRVREKRGARRS